MQKNVAIWGAGRIGRGFAADVFSQGGYKIHFWDKNKELIKKLRENQQYTIYKYVSKDNETKEIITNYETYSSTEEESFIELMCNIELIVISVFPSSFDEIAKNLSEIIEKRVKRKNESKLNIVICANIINAGERLKESICKYISEEYSDYMHKNVGVIETIVLRMAVATPQEILEQDELAVVTNGYPKLIMNKSEFKGEKLNIDEIIYTDNFEAWERRKLYTYNMLHALFAYTGKQKNYKTVYECTLDHEIMAIADGALEEVNKALQVYYGFSESEMKEWISECRKNMMNPLLNDQLSRVGSDPIRKLKPGDRLSGPALLAKKTGVMPYWLTKVIAYAFLYVDDSDEKSKELSKYVKTHGIKDASSYFCGLGKEPELQQLIFDRFQEILLHENNGFAHNETEIELYKKAWESGFSYEKKVKGCAQCALLAIRDSLNIFDEKVFEAATAFSAGIGLCGDSVCGGYAAGSMAVGLISPRKLKNLVDKDKIGQYEAYRLGQMLHDKFIDTYGSTNCKDIHKRIFGESFIIRDDSVKQKFEEAGAHFDKCTVVVAMSLYLLTALLKNETDYIGT